MVYYKLVLNDKRSTNDGLYPVVVRITYNKNNTTINTGVRVKSNQWYSSSQLINKNHPNFQLLNKTISEFYLKIQKLVHELNNNFSFVALRDLLSDKPKIKVRVPSFYEYAQAIIKNMMDVQRTGNAIVYQTGVNRLVNFSGNRNLSFEEINYTFLEDFKQKLLLEGAKINTIGNYLRSIRAIYNKAIKAKLVDRALFDLHLIDA